MIILQMDSDADGNGSAMALQLAVRRITLNLAPETSMLHDEEQGLFAVTLHEARVQAALEDGIADVRQVNHITLSPARLFVVLMTQYQHWSVVKIAYGLA